MLILVPLPWADGVVLHTVTLGRERVKAKELLDHPSFKASRGWYEKWKRRHSVSMQKKTTLAQQLPTNLEENIVRFHHFIIAARKRSNYPLSCIYNMDETPMHFELPLNRTLEFSGSQTVSVKSCGAEKRSFTVVLAVSANGAKVPPKVIFKGICTPEIWLCRSLFVFPPIRKGGWMNRASENGFDRVCHMLSIPFWCGTHSELTWPIP